jgi:hypothetical protein
LLQVWSGAAEHVSGGARYKKDKISEYLKNNIQVPFTPEQPSALRARLATTYACFILGATNVEGSAASGIRQYARRWRFMPELTAEASIEGKLDSQMETWMTPCCTLASSSEMNQYDDDEDETERGSESVGGVKHEREVQDAAMRVVGMIQNSFPDLQARLIRDYVDFVLTEAFGTVEDTKTGVLVWASQCAAPEQEHVVFDPHE